MRLHDLLASISIVACSCVAGPLPPAIGPAPPVVSVDVEAQLYEEPAVDVVTVSLDGEAISDIDVFYDQLEPYGTWYDDPDYGWVFAPDAAGFIPYSNGHWTYTTYGLAWVSLDPFGWATAHYGRWIFHNRWVWVPGTTWAPAWVTWRMTADGIAWAPCGFGVDAYIPDMHWRIVDAALLLSIDLRLHYRTHDHRRFLDRSAPIARFYRHGETTWAAGPSEAWLRARHLSPVLQRPTPSDLGRFDRDRRDAFARHAGERRPEWNARRQRERSLRDELQLRERRQRAEQERLVESQRRWAEERRSGDQQRQQELRERQRAEQRQRDELLQRQRAEQERARSEQERRIETERRVREERRRVDEQRRGNEERERVQRARDEQQREEQRRRQDEDQRRRQADEQRRRAEEQQRVQRDQQRTNDEQRRRQQEEQRARDQQRTNDEQRRRQDEEQGKQAEDQRRKEKEQPRKKPPQREEPRRGQKQRRP